MVICPTVLCPQGPVAVRAGGRAVLVVRGVCTSMSEGFNGNTDVHGRCAGLKKTIWGHSLIWAGGKSLPSGRERKRPTHFDSFLSLQAGNIVIKDSKKCTGGVVGRGSEWSAGRWQGHPAVFSTLRSDKVDSSRLSLFTPTALKQNPPLQVLSEIQRGELSCLDWCFSECGSLTSSKGISWQLVRNSASWVPPQACWIRTWGWDSAVWNFTSPLGDSHAQIWEP